MKRTFAKGTGANRRSVMIETSGPRMAVTQVKADGTSTRSEKHLGSEAEARSATELMARELLGRGFVEQATPGSPHGVPVAARVTGPSKPKPAPRAPEPVATPADTYGMEEEPAEAPAPIIPRVTSPPASSSDAEKSGTKAKKTGRKKKKRKKKGAGGDGLDKRVLAGAGAAGVLFLGFVGFLVYDIFLKPASIVGTWQGSRLEYETGGPMSFMQYRLVLDEQKRAALTLQGDITSTGTYEVKGDRLVLTFIDNDEPAGGGGEEEVPGGEDEEAVGGEGEEEVGDGGGGGGAETLAYEISLGRATLDLYDITTKKKVVELVRQREKPSLGGPSRAPAAPKGVAAADVAGGDPAADAQLASVQFAPKDNAFKVKHPPGWETETGSRPDNTYSWARFTKGSAKIQVFADVAGSLMAGQNTGDEPEGSSFAPVHKAHELYKRTISEEFAEYNESEPTLFKGSLLGEGRIATLKATESGLFGSKVEGFRITLLTNDRRITVLCTCASRDLEKMKPTFFAVGRSVSR
jgi:hypothetical protein